MDIRPIKTEADYEAALAEVETIFDAEPNTPEGDRLDILTTLIEAYEAKDYPVALPDPIEAIIYYVESRGRSVQELGFVLGDQNEYLDVINRKKPLTLEMIRTLNKELGVPADILIQPYMTMQTAA